MCPHTKYYCLQSGIIGRFKRGEIYAQVQGQLKVTNVPLYLLVNDSHEGTCVVSNCAKY